MDLGAYYTGFFVAGDTKKNFFLSLFVIIPKATKSDKKTCKGKVKIMTTDGKQNENIKILLKNGGR